MKAIFGPPQAVVKVVHRYFGNETSGHTRWRWYWVVLALDTSLALILLRLGDLMVCVGEEVECKLLAQG